MLGFLSGAFLLKKSLHYLKVKENLLCYLGGRPFKVNQHETKKPTSRVINRRYACFFSTGNPWCVGRQQRAVKVYIKPLPHPSYISGGWAKPLLKPGCLTQSQHRLWLRWSHRSSTHAHSDAAGFSVINKKWRHEVLAGWLAEPQWRSASKSSGSGLLLGLFLIYVPGGGRCICDTGSSLQGKECHSRWLKNG